MSNDAPRKPASLEKHCWIIRKADGTKVVPKTKTLSASQALRGL